MFSASWSIFSLVGHSGFDHISGPHLHVNNWSVQTLQKVCSVLLLLHILTVWVWFTNVSVCVAVRIMGSHFKMLPTWSTTLLSDQSSVLPSALRTLEKYVTCLGSCHRFHATANLSSHAISFLNFQVILTADVSGNHGSRIFVSDDFGKSFTPQQLPFFPLMQITYNPENSSVLMALSSKVSTSSEYAIDMVYLQF